MPTLKNIFVHCSDSGWGEVVEISRWHKLRGWSAIGYHYVILNGKPFSDVAYMPCLDGAIQPGRHLNDDSIFSAREVGVHVAGRNSSSLGICLIGKNEFTPHQFFSLQELLEELLLRFSLTLDDVLGHYEDPNTDKTCPNIPMSALREFLKGELSLINLQKAISDQYQAGHANLGKKSEVAWYENWKIGKVGH